MTKLEEMKRMPGIKKLRIGGNAYSLLGSIGLIVSAYALATGGYAIGAKKAFLAMAEEYDEAYAQTENKSEMKD